jgi:hypothetical protein
MENKIAAPGTLMTIPRKVLLYAYLVLPIFLVIVLIDIFFLDSRFSPYLGVEALFSPFYIILFLLPHIIASFFSFFDREYVHYYRKHLFIYLPLLLTGTALLLYYDFVWGLVFFLVNDMWHGVRQQVGIGLILGAKPGIMHYLWTLVPFFVGSVAYVYVVQPAAYLEVLVPYISPALFIGVLLILLITAVQMWRSPSTVRWYIFAASMLFVCSYFFILTGYVFFSILAFRSIHDITAFAFYMTHDYNRAQGGYRNYFYALISKVPRHVMFLTLILGVLLAYVVRTATDDLTIGLSIVILICMSHFYLESVMWKRGTPHRQFVQVT